MDNIEEQVLELVREQAGIDSHEICLNSKFEDLNLDSVAIVELVFLLEETFKISIESAPISSGASCWGPPSSRSGEARSSAQPWAWPSPSSPRRDSR